MGKKKKEKARFSIEKPDDDRLGDEELNYHEYAIYELSDEALPNKRALDAFEDIGKSTGYPYLNKKSIEVFEQEFLEQGQSDNLHSFTLGKKEMDIKHGILRSFNSHESLSEAVSEQTTNTASQNKNTPLEYQVYLMLLKNFVLKCCNGQLYMYNKRYGYFKRLTEIELTVFIRRNVSVEIDKALNRHKLEEVIYRLKSCPEIQIENGDFDRHSHLINFRNYVLDTLENITLNHSAQYLFSSYIDADYDRSPQEGRIFRKFLEDCTQRDESTISSLQQLTGYAISNYSRAKRLFLLIGQPHTGKSVWLGLWKELIGKNQTTAMTLKQLSENRFMQTRLAHSKLNISPEMDEDGPLKGTSFLKSITGGDLITGDVKGEAPIDFYSTSTLIAAGNHMPTFRQDGTSAFADRLLFIIFKHTVPENERDKLLMEKLLAERSYIVRWALQGLQELIENNFVFTECKEGVRFKRQYISELKHIDHFIRKMCTVDKNNFGLKVQRKHLYPVYKCYCTENCIKAMSPDELWHEIKSLGLTSTKVRMYGSTGLQGFRGIKLKKEPTEYLKAT